MKYLHLSLLLPLFLMLIFSSCLDEEESTSKKYAEWREKNVNYINQAEKETIDGKLRYKKIIPVWDNSVFTLMEWHNERQHSAEELYPLANSTVDIKYVLTNINGDTLDSSASYRCNPNATVTGFWTALTNMLPGDTVTAIVPYTAGYGSFSHGSVLPYSTLIFNIRLDSIVAYETLPWR